MRSLFARRKLWVIAGILLVTGLVRLPLETRFLEELRADGFLPEVQGKTLGEKAGVQIMIGALGGLRYMMATFLELRASYHWEYQDWEKILENYQLVHLLQPRNAESWEFGAWQCHSNAWAWYKYDDKKNTPERREAIAGMWLDRGQTMLEQGIRWNPDNPWLYRELANLLRLKRQDICGAAEVYRQASLIENAPGYMKRFHAYFLAQCGEDDERAYRLLREIYDEGERVLRQQGILTWKGTLIVELHKVEQRLGIPREQRIRERFDDVTLQVASPLFPERSHAPYRNIYEREKRHFEETGEMIWDPLLIATLKEIEEKLRVPQSERIPEEVDSITHQIITPLRP